MTRSRNRVFAIAIGFWIAFAPVMFAAQVASGAMPIPMSDESAHAECDGCPDGGMGRDNCAIMCANASTLAAVPQPDVASQIYCHRIAWPVRYATLIGRNPAPELGPPRSV